MVVADASEHGVGAALQMATARAFLLYGMHRFEGPARLVSQINPFLVSDGMLTGRFLTLFLVEIDPAARTLRWVRAGHDPALLYRPGRDSFERLYGEGLALGIDAAYPFQENVLRGWSPGDVLVVRTDGIHEAFNAEGEMFGEARLRAAIRAHAAEPAEALQEAVIAALDDFRGTVPLADDVTLVIVKFR